MTKVNFLFSEGKFYDLLNVSTAISMNQTIGGLDPCTVLVSSLIQSSEVRSHKHREH